MLVIKNNNMENNVFISVAKKWYPGIKRKKDLSKICQNKLLHIRMYLIYNVLFYQIKR